MTIEITGRRQWDAWQARVLPPVEEVRGGLWSIPVPIPDNPLRYVLVYALESDDGLVLVDAGWDDDVSWQALTGGLASIGARVSDVRAVLVTHFHADHLGLAGRVRAGSGAWVALHRLDAQALTDLGREPGRLVDGLRHHLELHGAPEAEVGHIVRSTPVDRFAGTPAPDVLLEDGETVKVPGHSLRVVWTPGHSPGHSCFYEADRRLLFSGDHVLPRITPQIGVFSRSPGDPLTDFLRSLDRLDRDDVDEVLPAHEYRFRGLPDRLAGIARHHARRIAQVHAAVREAPGRTAWDLAAVLPWSRSWDAIDGVGRQMAMAETLAHLVLLAGRGEVRESGDAPCRWYPRDPQVVEEIYGRRLETHSRGGA
jgi:glyoxylase-like metal-dependent hydrolase (beta-lactamase superfamily II)